jgi:hypothetical protein
MDLLPLWFIWAVAPLFVMLSVMLTAVTMSFLWALLTVLTAIYRLPKVYKHPLKRKHD